MTYLVCEVELNTKIKKKKDFLHGFSLVLCRNSLLSLLKNKRKWSMTKTFTLVVTSWILGIGFTVTMILIAEMPPGVECVNIDANIPTWYMNIFLGFILLTSILTVINYGSIGLMIRSSNHQVTSYMPFTMQQLQRRKSNIRVAKMTDGFRVIL